MFKKDFKQSFSRIYFATVSCWLLISAIIFFSCSNEEESSPIEEDDTSDEVEYDFIDSNDTLNISICEAEDIASAFMDGIAEYDNTQKASGIRHSMRKSSIVPDDNNEPVMYVVNFNPEGWCIVSATKKTQSILAYSDEGKFDLNELNDGVYDWMCDKMEIIKYIRNFDKDGAMSPAIIRPQDNIDDRERYSNDNISTPVVAKPRVVKVCGPLLKTTWGQNFPYNYYCPDGGCSGNNQEGHKKTGCVAIAAAQIVRYWETATTNYLWSDMPQNTDVSLKNLEGTYKKTSIKKYNGILSMAKLIHDIGVAVDMEYGCNGSSAKTKDIVDVLRKKFAFQSSGNYQKLNDSKAENKIIENINAKQPVIIRGKENLISIPNEGHAWICDGYKTLMSGASKSYLFHMNFGWNGTCNGWYTISLGLDELDDKTSHASTKYDNWRYYITGIKGK